MSLRVPLCTTESSAPSARCKCKKDMIKLRVKKEGNNQGRYFWKCKENKCNQFIWDPPQYDPSKFKRGACYKCGRWNCDAVDCEETHDWFGIPIPDDYASYSIE